MKKYLLLRDNRESGPYSLSELRELKLVAKDLVWIEGESTCWLYPSELEELKDFISIEKKQPRKIYVSRPRTDFEHREYYPSREFTPASEEEIISSPTVQEKGIWKSKKFSSISNVFSVAAVSCGLILGAIAMKKAVDSSEKPVMADDTPLTVITETVPSNPPVQNALLTEMVPAKQAVAKTVRPVKTKTIREQVSIKASDYSVGVLGGISNLQLKLFNSSSHKLDKVTLSIQYLKPNGSVIETDQYEMYSIKPYSTGTLVIPDSKRGVKVKYRIIDISSKEIRQI